MIATRVSKLSVEASSAIVPIPARPACATLRVDPAVGLRKNWPWNISKPSRLHAWKDLRLSTPAATSLRGVVRWRTEATSSSSR